MFYFLGAGQEDNNLIIQNVLLLVIVFALKSTLSDIILTIIEFFYLIYGMPFANIYFNFSVSLIDVYTFLISIA